MKKLTIRVHKARSKGSNGHLGWPHLQHEILTISQSKTQKQLRTHEATMFEIDNTSRFRSFSMFFHHNSHSFVAAYTNTAASCDRFFSCTIAHEVERSIPKFYLNIIAIVFRL